MDLSRCNMLRSLVFFWRDASLAVITIYRNIDITAAREKSHFLGCFDSEQVKPGFDGSCHSFGEKKA